jgi:diguanylate cyclase (GGDEF)-like protein
VERLSPNSSTRAEESSWLCPRGFDRERMLDMDQRVRPVRQRAAVIMTLAILAAGPWLGWWPLAFVVCILSCFSAADRLMPKLRRPEYLMFGAWVGSAIVIAVAVALSGGAGASALSLMAIPVITLSSRFSMRGVIVGVLISELLTLLVALLVDAGPVRANPVLLIIPVALVLCASVLTTPLMRSDIEHRSDAVIDELTGLLNRTALTARVAELEQQSVLTGEPVGLIVCDIDHFKSINDSLGHAGGDIILSDAAYLLRKHLRAFDLVYRIGGEEFLVLLPGSNLAVSAGLADKLHAAVSDSSFDNGARITMSLGVSASGESGAFDYQSVFAAADLALYEAKRSGRDRVCVAGHEPVAELA